MSNTPQQVSDEAQYRKMSEVLSGKVRTMQEELERERAERARVEEERARAQKEYEEERARVQKEHEEMRAHLDRIKQEKKQEFSHVIAQDVRPFLDGLKKSERAAPSIQHFERMLEKGLEDAFMDENSLATLNTIRAAASSNQVTSSKLEEMFQNQKAWEEKLAVLQKEKQEAEERARAQEEEKVRMLEELRKELAELKQAKQAADENIKNVESHFESAPAAPAPATSAPAPPVITATASSSTESTGLGTLFSFEPRTNWKSTSNDFW
jgi:chromosome segregation ATPase